jgi:hypothetical protein
MIAGKYIDPEKGSKIIPIAVAYAHFLHEEVQNRKKQIKGEPRLTLIEFLKEHGKL